MAVVADRDQRLAPVVYAERQRIAGSLDGLDLALGPRAAPCAQLGDHLVPLEDNDALKEGFSWSLPAPFIDFVERRMLMRPDGNCLAAEFLEEGQHFRPGRQ